MSKSYYVELCYQATNIGSHTQPQVWWIIRGVAMEAYGAYMSINTTGRRSYLCLFNDTAKGGKERR